MGSGKLQRVKYAEMDRVDQDFGERRIVMEEGKEYPLIGQQAIVQKDPSPTSAFHPRRNPGLHGQQFPGGKRVYLYRIPSPPVSSPGTP